ncbi:MAG: hypothetical protein U9R23_05535, partial [Candidatus Cloacimonadota bacterium]|nr:hypothetical protein [Candidatus Cloacimonadota bacterium]
MKKLITLLTVAFFTLVMSTTAWGELVFDENFDYPAEDNLTDHGWTAHSGGGTNPITVSSGGLTYSGYPSSGIGNAALLDNTGEDVSRNFPEQSSGAVYASFLVNVHAAPFISSGKVYFFHLGETDMGYYFKARVFVKEEEGTDNIAFGLSKKSSTADEYTDFVYLKDVTYLIVEKYEFFEGEDDDEVSLFVFESPTLPGSEPGTPTLGPVTDLYDAANLGTVALRQYDSAQDLLVDGIRIATTWEDIVVASVDDYPSSVASFSLYQNYPNPFSASTTISFNLATDLHPSSAVAMLRRVDRLTQIKI